MTIGKLIGVGRSAQVFCWGDRKVIKLFPKRTIAAFIKYETWVTKFAYQVGLPVPQVEEIIEIGDKKGIVSERVIGNSMLTDIRSKPWKIFYFAKLLAELQTQIHRCYIPKLVDLKHQRKLQIKAVKVLPVEEKQAILNLLDRLPTGQSLCHGDFHPDNIILAPDKSTVIDWSDAVEGNPFADVARTLLILCIGNIPTNLTWIPSMFFRGLFCAIYLQNYLKLNHVTWKQIKPWLVPEAAAWLNYCLSVQEKRFLIFIIEKLLYD